MDNVSILNFDMSSFLVKMGFVKLNSVQIPDNVSHFDLKFNFWWYISTWRCVQNRFGFSKNSQNPFICDHPGPSSLSTGFTNQFWSYNL